MRKGPKKMSLHRETLLNLQESEMRRAAGGSQPSVFCIESDGGTDCYSPTMCFWGCSISGQTCRHC